MSLLASVIAAFAALQAAPGESSREAQGPATLCFEYTRFRLEPAERVIEVEMGPEAMRIDIAGPRGRYHLVESGIHRGLEGSERKVAASDGFAVYRDGLAYAVVGRPDFSPDEDRLLVWMSGPAFTGRGRDAAIYSRLAPGGAADGQCDRRYDYGWDIFPGSAADAPGPQTTTPAD